MSAKTWFMRMDAQHPSNPASVMRAGDVFIDEAALEKQDVFLLFDSHYVQIRAFHLLANWRIAVYQDADRKDYLTVLLPTDPVWVNIRNEEK